MNLLEHYIKEIHSVEVCNEKWVQEFPDRIIMKIDLTCDCYGRISRDIYYWRKEMWEDIKQQGYFMC